MEIDRKIVEPGFFYHYKRNPHSVIVEEGAYELVGIGKTMAGKDLYAIYRPVYKKITNSPDEVPAQFHLRPLEEFLCKVVSSNNSRMLRFTRITQEEVLFKLRELSRRMYP